MTNKTGGEGRQRRLWTTIAEDIGVVLRNQLVQSRAQRASQSSSKHSAAKGFLKELLSEKAYSNIGGNTAKKVYFMGNLKAVKPQR